MGECCVFIGVFIMFIILVQVGWRWEALAGKLLIPGINFSWMAAVSAARINCLHIIEEQIE